MKKLLILLVCVLLMGCAQEAAEEQQAQDNTAAEEQNMAEDTQEDVQETPEPEPEPEEEDEGPITEAEAKQIAIRQLGGIPTDIDKETRDGVEVYVVEVDPPSRDKINVIIEIATGDILGFE